jgi:hypothetical protein
MDANKIFEIRDTDIAIEEIRERIKKNLEKKVGSGNYPPDPNPLKSSNSRMRIKEF